MSEWEERAGCHHPLVDPEIFHPTKGAGTKRIAGLALHTCHTHCPVRAACRSEALLDPPADPQILGGLRWVSDGCHSARLETHPTPQITAGCLICREGS